MIKDCKVVLHNQYVTVVDYNGIEIQFPSVKNDGVVYVKYENGSYSVVTKNEYDKSKKPTKFDVVNKLKKAEVVGKTVEAIKE